MESTGIKRNPFVAAVLTLLSGTMVAQVIGLLSIPLLTRLYTPTDFAVFALMSAILTVSMTFSTGRYEFALLVCEDDRERAEILVLGLGLGCLTSLIGGVFCAVAWWWQFAWLPLPASWIALVPALLLICSLTSVGNQHQVVAGRFRLVAAGEVCMVLVVACSQLFLGASWGSASDYLIIGMLLGRTAALAFVSHGIIGFLWRQRSTMQFGRLWRTAVRYKRFPTFTTLFELTAAASNEMPAFVLRLWFPPSALGFFSLSMRVLEKPVQLVNKAVSPVVLKRVAEIRDQHQRIDSLLLRMSGWLFLLISPGAIVLFFFAPPLFAFAFGKEWQEAGIYAQLLLPLLVVRFATLPSWTGLIGRGKPQLMLVWTTVHLVVTVAAMLALVPLGRPTLVVLAFSIAGALTHLLLLKINGWASRGAIGRQSMVRRSPNNPEDPAGRIRLGLEGRNC